MTTAGLGPVFENYLIYSLSVYEELRKKNTDCLPNVTISTRLPSIFEWIYQCWGQSHFLENLFYCLIFHPSLWLIT